MKQDNMLAMILAGGRGSRLHELTSKVAKPAVSYGGKYRIIDFPLSNCANSGIDVVGVLTQYESVLLNSYVSAGRRWGLDAKDSGVYVLPPREKADAELNVYRGTADAISQNIDFIDSFAPDYLLILSGDHIYKMNYAKMLAYHKEHKADATIAVIPVPMKEASRFGIMNTHEDGRIYEFEEKPAEPKSNLASMGIYIFSWKTLSRLLLADIKNPDSHHDFGKDIIPVMLGEGKSLYAYQFKGYWKDVGTIDSLWEANMDLLRPNNEPDLNDRTWKIYTEDVMEIDWSGIRRQLSRQVYYLLFCTLARIRRCMEVGCIQLDASLADHITCHRAVDSAGEQQHRLSICANRHSARSRNNLRVNKDLSALAKLHVNHDLRMMHIDFQPRKFFQNTLAKDCIHFH